MTHEIEHSIENFENPSSEQIPKNPTEYPPSENIQLEIPIDTEHAHHWIIMTPNGPTSEGCCKGCGEMREFKNWLEKLQFVSD